MKTSKFYLAFTAITFAAIMFVVSCKKNETTDSDTTSASDSNLAETSTDNLTNMTSRVSENMSTSYRSTSLSATVTHDTTHKKIFVLFNGVVCNDGHVRSGKIILDYSKSTFGAKYFRDPGFKVVVSDSAYSDNGNTITVHKTITNTTPQGFSSSSTNETWAITDTISVAKSGGGTVTMNATRTLTLLNTNTAYHGAATPISWDSANVGLMGNAQITDSQGDLFTINITSQLVRDYNCTPITAYPSYHPISAGAFNFTPPGKATRYITYDGTCDNMFTVTIKGIAFKITQ